MTRAYIHEEALKKLASAHREVEDCEHDYRVTVEKARHGTYENPNAAISRSSSRLRDARIELARRESIVADYEELYQEDPESYEREMKALAEAAHEQAIRDAEEADLRRSEEAKARKAGKAELDSPDAQTRLSVFWFIRRVSLFGIAGLLVLTFYGVIFNSGGMGGTLVYIGYLAGVANAIWAPALILQLRNLGAKVTPDTSHYNPHSHDFEQFLILLAAGLAIVGAFCLLFWLLNGLPFLLALAFFGAWGYLAAKVLLNG